MSETKPLRQEEYASMAEELRRTQAENAILRAKRSYEQEARFNKIMKTAWRVVVVGVCSVAVMIGAVSVAALFGAFDKPARKAPCFFTRHRQYESADKEAMPWEKWHVYRSAETDATNVLATDVDFATKADAWAFIQKWNLEACR